MNELTIACNLSADELRERGEDLLPGLLPLSESPRPTENGYVLTFPATALHTGLRTVESEREFCPFSRFEITLEPTAGPLSVTLTGPTGTREFIATFIDA